MQKIETVCVIGARVMGSGIAAKLPTLKLMLFYSILPIISQVIKTKL